MITELGTGEALVSLLGDKGAPSKVERTLIRPPSSRLGPCDPKVRAKVAAQSPVAGLYERAVDRESAYEMLAARAASKAEKDPDVDPEELGAARRHGGRYSRGARLGDGREPARARRSDTPREAAAKSAMRSADSQLGRTIVRSLLKGLFR